jgi:hypothetical protein
VNYPKSIYKKYEIVEKDICGEKHYGLVVVCSLFGFKWKRTVKVCEFGHIRDSGRTWRRDKSLITAAINYDHMMSEWAFERKMTK